MAPTLANSPTVKPPVRVAVAIAVLYRAVAAAIAAGDRSFVAGRRATNSDAAHDGVFLFVDNSSFDFPSGAAEIPIAEWGWKSQGSDVRHIGPMAQDFADAFEVGEDRRHISTVDAYGVAMAAIQGLNERLDRVVERKTSELPHSSAS